MMKTIIYGSLTVLKVFLLCACGTDQTGTNTNEDKISAVVTTTDDQNDQAIDSEPQEFNPKFISVRGYVDVPPEQRVSVSPFFGGYVQEIKVLPGTHVNKGAVLFTLQNPFYVELQQQYLEAVQQLDYLKEDYERQKVLSGEEIVSRKNYKKAEADYKVMTTKASGLREQLKMLGLSISAIEQGRLSSSVSVRSTITGSVTEVNIQKGVYVDPKDVAINIINTDHLHLELEIFEQDASRIREGQEIRFTVPELSKQEYTGAVYLVVPSIDLQKRTILVHGHIEEEYESEFLPGMYVDARILVDEL